MVKASSEAVRPSLNVTTQEETNGDSLSHHGETAADVDDEMIGDEDEEEAQEPVIRRAPRGPTKE